MNRSEFLHKLQEALENDLDGSVVKENVSYYDNYIRNEIRNGKTEKEVMDMLGDPWIIARTIIGSYENGQSFGSYSYTEEPDHIRYEEEGRKQKTGNPYLHFFGIDTWWKKLCFFLGIIVAVVLLLAVITGVIRLLLPLAVPIVLIILFLRMFGRKG